MRGKLISKTIIRIQKRDNPFVQIDKNILNNEKLSWRAKGLLAYLLSLPPDWKVYLEEVSEHAHDGVTSTMSAFKELKIAGYVKKIATKDEKGRIVSWETVVSEVPNLNGEATMWDGPDVGNPQCGETAPTNIDNTNKDQLTNIDKNTYVLFVEWFNKEFKRKFNPEIYEKKINARLKKFTIEQLKKSCLGMKANPHMMGKNDNKQVYATVEYITRNDANVEKWLNNQPANGGDNFGWLDASKFNKFSGQTEFTDENLPDM